jgi:quinol monooxygenase YgiN
VELFQRWHLSDQPHRIVSQQIDSIHSYEWGTNNSPEKLGQGFTHLFFVTFKDEAGRAKYLPHPAHLAFVEKLKPILEEPMVIDYWAKSVTNCHYVAFISLAGRLFPSFTLHFVARKNYDPLS